VFAILICLAQFFLPSMGTLSAEIQIHAMIMSIAVFAFIAFRLLAGGHSRHFASRRAANA
jgi:hypothetical protein